MPEPMTVLKGTLDVLALKALSWGPMHGFEITRWLESSSASVLEVDEAALYQALYRMEARGLVEGEGVGGRRGLRRLFRLPVRGPAAVARDVDDEIRSHLEERAESLVARGLSPDAAWAEAERRFGSRAGGLAPGRRQ